MNFFESLTSKKTALWWSFIIALVITYPNINQFLWRVFSSPGSYHYEVTGPESFVYFIYRYLFFTALTWILINTNIRFAARPLKFRFWRSLLLTVSAYLVYVLIGITIEYGVRMDCFTQLVILQFIIAWLVSVLTGHIYNLTVVQREKEREIERLKTETLQSKVEALSNQINPHFFFNSLNGLTALVAAERYGETTEYVSKLSNIFRYILQSDKKGLVTLDEELRFLEAYRYLIEVRYSGKICFRIDVPEADLSLKMPVLSILPLVENVIKHNIIDSDHKMLVTIRTTDGPSLVVSNPVQRKLNVEGSNGIGLANLSARYKLLTGADITITEYDRSFEVVLPLTEIGDEGTDS